MRNLSEHLTDTFRRIYGLHDWKVAVRISKARRSDACGSTAIRAPYKEACITLYPAAIKETKRHYPFETAESVLHHEFAHVALAALVPGMVLSDEQEEMAVEHLAAMIMRLVPIYGVDDDIAG